MLLFNFFKTTVVFATLIVFVVFFVNFLLVEYWTIYPLAFVTLFKVILIFFFNDFFLVTFAFPTVKIFLSAVGCIVDWFAPSLFVASVTFIVCSCLLVVCSGFFVVVSAILVVVSGAFVVSTVFVVVSGAFVVGCVTVASPTYFQTPHWPHVSGLSPSVHHFAWYTFPLYITLFPPV